MDNSRAVQWHSSIIILLAAFLGRNASDNIGTTFKNERQQSVNDFWSCIMDDSRAVQWHTPIIIILAAFLGDNASADINTTS